jgi:GT2 family glycosyltransferase
MCRVRADEQTHLGRILAECATRLELAAARSEQAELLAVAARLLDVKHALDQDVARGRRRTPRKALRQWLRPRLGQLRHHSPVVLRVPIGYLRTEPPPHPPKISIVTPSYQQGRYLERTIYSVLSQNYPRLQYVVQDGGSSDETTAVLERFAGSLQHSASEPDGGQADAINRGFAHTDGEIMAYLNSDDLLLPGSLSYVAAYFAAHPEVDVVYGHRVMIDEHDREVGRWVLPAHDSGILPVSDFIPQETMFWRRPLWEGTGAQIDTSLNFAIDWDLLLRFRSAGARMVRLPRYLGAFRVHAEQKTARQQALCRVETELLQRRELGRTMTEEEVFARTQPFLRRHVLHHTAHRLAARLPLPRIDVRTVPLEVAEEAAATPAFDRR